VDTEPTWVSAVRSSADRLEAELRRVAATTEGKPPDLAIAHEAIVRAREAADRPFANRRHRLRRFGAWWTGNDVDGAWAALHTAGQALLGLQTEASVRAQLGDIAASIVTELSSKDIRRKGYLNTVEECAKPAHTIDEADRAQLRAIRQACDGSADAAHGDARAFRNTLVVIGFVLAVLLGVVAIFGFADNNFRTLFAGTTGSSRWYVAELAIVASLAGFTAAIVSLQQYSGYQYNYGLSFVQAFLKAGTGGATGLMGVVLVQSGTVKALNTQRGAGVFAIAVVFGYAQYLFTRLVDRQANAVLSSAGSRHDPSANTGLSDDASAPNLATTQASTEDAAEAAEVQPPGRRGRSTAPAVDRTKPRR